MYVADSAPTKRVSVRRTTPTLRAVNLLGSGLCFAAAMMLLVASGCRSAQTWDETVGNNTVAVDRVSQSMGNPTPQIHNAAWSEAPVTVRDRADLSALLYRDTSLDELLRIAMQNSDVLRELGGTVLRNPDSIHSRFTGTLAHSDPRFSPEAALSAFDAQLQGTAYFSNNDRIYNNPFDGGGQRAFQQDLHEYSLELSKVTATGSQLALRSISVHDANNSPGNTFASAWNTYVEGEIRQPLLQGGGLQFNRIAGPGSSPGVYNGILLAKANAQLTQADFEVAVRDYINDVTNVYWDLYFAYRDLDSRSRAMKQALDAWNRIKARQESDLESGAAEALAREQYFRFKSEVDEALTGRVTQGTRSGSGSTGGTLEGAGGVQTTERRLRLLVGMKITDGELIRPSDEPTQADIVFDWHTVQQEALQLRPELRKQQTAIRKRQMELMASKNFLNPRLDAVGRYRFRGFGDDLARTDSGDQAYSSAARNLLGGDQQEWFVGMEYTVPIGYRKAHLAVRNAEVLLCRERIVQREQQRSVVHDLSNAITDAARSYEACRNSLNRLMAAQELLAAYQAQDDNDMDIDVDHLLDAQRRVVEAEIRYFRSRTEYALALKNVHMEKGSLLQYHNLQIFDQPRVAHQGQMIDSAACCNTQSAAPPITADAAFPPRNTEPLPLTIEPVSMSETLPPKRS